MDLHVVCGILRRDEKVMVARRLETSGALGLWEFPGGKIHPGESAEQALQREFQEELALEIQVDEAVACSWQRQGQRRLCLHAYTVQTLSDAAPVLSVHSEVQWVSPLELAQWREFSEPDRPFLSWFDRLAHPPIS